MQRRTSTPASTSRRACASSPTLRLDGYILDGQNRSNIDPRIVVRYKLDDFWTAKAYVGPLSPSRRNPRHLIAASAIRISGSSTARSMASATSGAPDHLWSIDSEIYYVDRRDLVVFTDDAIQNSDGTFTYINFTNTGRAYSYGFEAIIKREISERFYAWLSYTFSRARQQNNDGHVARDGVRRAARAQRGRELQARAAAGSSACATSSRAVAR